MSPSLPIVIIQRQKKEKKRKTNPNVSFSFRFSFFFLSFRDRRHQPTNHTDGELLQRTEPVEHRKPAGKQASLRPAKRISLSIHDKTMTKHLDIAHDPGEKLLWSFLPFLFLFFVFFFSSKFSPSQHSREECTMWYTTGNFLDHSLASLSERSSLARLCPRVCARVRSRRRSFR